MYTIDRVRHAVTKAMVKSVFSIRYNKIECINNYNHCTLKPTAQIAFEQLADVLFDLIFDSKHCVDDFNVYRLYLLF